MITAAAPFLMFQGKCEEALTSALGEGGKLLMPPDDYGFSQRFGWAQDRFGVSRQVNCR